MSLLKFLIIFPLFPYYYSNRASRSCLCGPKVLNGLHLGGSSWVGSSLAQIFPFSLSVEKKMHSVSKHISYLSRGGRLSLIEATLTSAPFYYLLMFKIHSKLAKAVKRISETFGEDPHLEGGNILIHWIWSPPEKFGDLGSSNMRMKDATLQ